MTVGQDISDRQLQFAAGGQFSLGKSRRGYGPMGPWIVTPDELADPDDLGLGCSVDGEVVQDARTSDLIFGVAAADRRAVRGAAAAARRRDLHRHPGRRRRHPASRRGSSRPARSLETWIEGIGTIRNRCVGAGVTMTDHVHVDLHAHFLPDAYRDAATAAGHAQPDGMPALPAWSATEHVAVMDRLGIATSLLSVSSPGVHFGDDVRARALAREVNEEGRRAVVDHPGRFGLFASLPTPDVDGAIAEIRHCYDRLDVDGVAMLTNVGGQYLGDPALEPIFDELDRRRARVFIHPTSPVCWEHTSLGRPRPMLEFLFDTTRAVVDLVLRGTVARHPDVEFIVPHAGATLPMIADRVAAFALLLTGVDSSADVLGDLGRLHYDLAGFPVPRQLDALLALTTLEHVHYGSDFPFTPEVVVERSAELLAHAGATGGSLIDQLAANTTRLFPDLARHGSRR